MSASNIDKCQILSVVGNHVISCPDILDFVAMVFTKICHDIHWVSTFQTSAFIKLHPVVFNPTITPNILDSIINLQHIFLGVHSFNLNTRSGLWQQHFGLWFCSSHAPKITLHLVFHGFHPSPPQKHPTYGIPKFHAPKNTPTFPIPQCSSKVDVCYTHAGPRQETQPSPRRAGRKPPKISPSKLNPSSNVGGVVGPPAMHALRRHVIYPDVCASTLNPARPGSRQSAAPRPSLAGRKPPFPSLPTSTLPPRLGTSPPCGHTTRAATVTPRLPPQSAAGRGYFPASSDAVWAMWWLAQTCWRWRWR